MIFNAWHWIDSIRLHCLVIRLECQTGLSDRTYYWFIETEQVACWHADSLELPEEVLPLFILVQRAAWTVWVWQLSGCRCWVNGAGCAPVDQRSSSLSFSHWCSSCCQNTNSVTAASTNVSYNFRDGSVIRKLVCHHSWFQIVEQNKKHQWAEPRFLWQLSSQCDPVDIMLLAGVCPRI